MTAPPDLSILDESSEPSTVADPPLARRVFGQSELVLVLVLTALGLSPWLERWFAAPAVQTWCTMFVAIVLQATPFLILGVSIAAAISHLLSERLLNRILPSNPVVAVPVAGIAGIALPACECASVPIAASLVRAGAAPAAAFTFLLAVPAINPVVLVATSMAFPGRPEMVLARFLASLAASVAVGWIWALRGNRVPLQLPARAPSHGHAHHHDHDAHAGGKLRAMAGDARDDFLTSGGYLVIGAGVAATVNTFFPRHLLLAVAHHTVLSILAMALFALAVAMCSEADAFVAASLTAFSLESRLVFLVVGPAVDVKLVAMHASYFGRRFAYVFGPLAFLAAVASALIVGGLVL